MCQRLEAQPDSPPVPVLRSSVGAGCDGFLQLQVQGSWAELEAAVAGLTDAAGLEQLLAWHWDLLVTTAGTEHVTAVPAGTHTDRSPLDSQTEPLYTYSYHASPYNTFAPEPGSSYMRNSVSLI